MRNACLLMVVTHHQTYWFVLVLLWSQWIAQSWVNWAMIQPDAVLKGSLNIARWSVSRNHQIIHKSMHQEQWGTYWRGSIDDKWQRGVNEGQVGRQYIPAPGVSQLEPPVVGLNGCQWWRFCCHTHSLAFILINRQKKKEHRCLSEKKTHLTFKVYCDSTPPSPWLKKISVNIVIVNFGYMLISISSASVNF
jgi:hypothetical protein